MSPSRATGRLIRAAAALTVTVLVLAGLPRPALAAETYVGTSSYLGAQALAIGTAGKSVPVYYNAYSVGGATLPADVTVKVDTTKSPGIIEAKLAAQVPGCSATSGVFTCTKSTGSGSGPDGDFNLVFTAGSTAKVGDVASVAVTVTATGARTSEQTYQLRIAEPGPDLRARDFTNASTPGGTVTFRPEFRNQGDRPAETLVVGFATDRFAALTDRFSNCHYAPEGTNPAAVCVVDALNLEPGEVATSAVAVSAKVTADVPGQTFVAYRADVIANGTDLDEPWEQWPLGTGPALGFQRQPVGQQAATADVDYTDNQGNVRITTPANPSDVAAQGATAKGKVGDTVSVKVGLTNKGPAFINGVSDGETSNPENPYNAAFVVTFPAGVQVTGIQVPAGDGNYCHGVVDGKVDETMNQVGRSVYRCMRWAMAVNETYTVTFTVKITGAVSTAGSVVARGGSSDPDTANNTAKVEFTGEDGLPITGPNAALTATLGVTLIIIGFGLYFAGRRPGAS
ncbi:hypothetical protein [Virgisporangium aurantiacum]|uniref:DUF11 domain-containing protein n=1 Tax=Virgisporangium aurantiacum TaxID=175570 RepID=A0A8J3ZEP6_9ACTN|nr:hypothetical protein [Virgisporangium aurantiacum]GIJ61428.1 hypothetical protein Vau01_089440 [Virgisporangium aurantiacum]